MGRALAVTVVLLALIPGPGGAQSGPQRYSGKVERVELNDGLVVVDELGRGGRRRLHEVYVDPDTPIVSSGRIPAHQIRSGSAYGELAVTLADLLTGDYVVVEAIERAGRMMARRITIVEPPPAPRR
jgi:hypothetical protein